MHPFKYSSFFMHVLQVVVVVSKDIVDLLFKNQMVDALPNCTIIFKKIIYVMCFNGIEIDKDGLRSK